VKGILLYSHTYPLEVLLDILIILQLVKVDVLIVVRHPIFMSWGLIKCSILGVNFISEVGFYKSKNINLYCALPFLFFHDFLPFKLSLHDAHIPAINSDNFILYGVLLDSFMLACWLLSLSAFLFKVLFFLLKYLNKYCVGKLSQESQTVGGISDNGRRVKGSGPSFLHLLFVQDLL
jgi:hypothetical protein